MRETWLRLKTRLSWRQTRNTRRTIAVGTIQGPSSGVWLQLDPARGAGRTCFPWLDLGAGGPCGPVHLLPVPCHQSSVLLRAASPSTLCILLGPINVPLSPGSGLRLLVSFPGAEHTAGAK